MPAGNSVNLVFGIIRLSVYPEVGISLSASKTDDRFYISHFSCVGHENASCLKKQIDCFDTILIRQPSNECHRRHVSWNTDRIYHRSPMQTEKSQPDCKRMMPETRFTEFSSLSVGLRVWIFRSASETDD